MLKLCMAFMVSMMSFSATAATLLVEDGQLTGATGVNVGGTIYDVDFVEGSCIDLFGGCDEQSDFDFYDLESASLAAQSLLDQVFIDGVSGNFDTEPETIFGCEASSLCTAFIPYVLTDHYNGPGVSVYYVHNATSDPWDKVAGTVSSIYKNVEGSTGTSLVYTSFTVSAVPFPSTVWLFGLGALMLFAMTRNRKQRFVFKA